MPKQAPGVHPQGFLPLFEMKAGAVCWAGGASDGLSKRKEKDVNAEAMGSVWPDLQAAWFYVTHFK